MDLNPFDNLAPLNPFDASRADKTSEDALEQYEESAQDSIEFQAKSAAITKETQQQITAINADRDLNTNSARGIGQAASQIK
jgi:hypothetical protein